MFKRVATAVIALLFFIPIMWFGSWPLELLMAVLAILAQMEFIQMKKLKLNSFPAIISSLGVAGLIFSQRLVFIFGGQVLIKLISLTAISLLIYALNKPDFKISHIASIVYLMTYIGIGFYAFVQLRATSLTFLILMLLIIWTTDSGAFLVGRKIGKRKLAPSVSPNKTVEGAVGGTAVATIVSAVYLLFFPLYASYFLTLLFMIGLSITGQLGDLIESKLKREYNIKDSGNLLPGHGGILDRFDSMLLVLNVIFIIGVL
ncbi:MAG: phosphatidate cytidylyltransferase [Alkalibacterium sp.]|nr:phosphatidate cytidylyltransferase [Alkalibacterium sp.]TVP92578.1 MAG: phosphatidate cytidylyltransferase [Alkalibacterium sp.]